jgi:subfamily B ATP-binding cassette protein HlyB/CyaB
MEEKAQTGLIALEVVSRVNNIAIDIRSIVKEYGIQSGEITQEELILIAKRNSFKTKVKELNLAKLEGYPLPAIIILNDQSFGVLLKIDKNENKVLFFNCVTQKSEVLSPEELYAMSSQHCIILSHKMMSTKIKFGFKWFLHEILKYKKIISEVLIASFVVQLFGLVTPLFTQVILDKVLVHRSLTTLDVLATAFIAVAVFEMMLNLARNYIFIHTTTKIDAKLGSKLFKHLMSLPYTYFENRKVGNIISRVRELDTIREFITNKAVSVIIDLFFSVVFLAVMFLYSVKLTLIVLGIVLLIGIIYLIVTPELRERLEHKFQTGAESNAYLVESVTGVETVKSLSVEGNMQKRWENYLSDYVKSNFRLVNLSNTTGAITGTLQKLMTIMILYVGVSLVINNQLSVGQLIAFQMFANQFTAPILRLVNLWNELQQVLLSVDKIGDVLNAPPEQDSSKAITLPKLNGEVKIDNIFFKYSPESPNVLDGISLHIKPGMRVGIVGQSGSGKSTVTKLIQRLYVAQSGAIYIDEVDVRHMNALWLRYNIGVVLQENYLFSGSIKDNIALARTDASMEEIIQAAKISGAHEFITLLSEGYDAHVGERGSNLSGGQRQRIAIARALLTDPKILIFDEATSALDNDSQKIIEQNLDQISKNRTMFIISHRLSIVKNCDLIVVMDKGHIVESGTWDELLAKEAYFHHLYTVGQ